MLREGFSVMPYNRFYTQFTDEQDWQYTLYILPSDANEGTVHTNLSSVNTFNLVELPQDFLLDNMSIDTELGEIPTGLVSQTLELSINLDACQGTAALDALRESLLQGTVQNANPYSSTGAKIDTVEGIATTFARFNTFILVVNDGSGQRPVFIGAQKFASENQLSITSSSEVVDYKIECFDIFRAITEAIPSNLFVEYMSTFKKTTQVNFGSGFSESLNVGKTRLKIGDYFAVYDGANPLRAVDFAVEDYNFFVNTFTNWKTLLDTMLSDFMRSLMWNVSSVLTLPIPFERAWTFYQVRNDINQQPSTIIDEPCYIPDIVKYRNDDDGNRVAERKGGVLSDPNALSKYSNVYEIITSIVENSLEIYRLEYSMSVITGAFNASYSSDYIKPQTGSGITFNSANILDKAEFKMFQETVKSATVSSSMLQGDKDTKEISYSEQGTSADNGKDLEIVFHNLGSATSRQARTDNGGLDGIYRFYPKYGINSGTIVWNNNGAVEKPDTKCLFKYSSTESINLDYNIVVIGGNSSPNAQLIIEQQTAGLPYTLAVSLVKAFGSAKQVEVNFTTTHDAVAFYQVGMQCTVDINSLSPLLTKIYNSNTGTGVITNHKLDVYTGKVGISVRMYE